MSNLYNLLHIGKSGVDAAQYGVQVAGQNIANVNTTGYHRRTVLQEQANISPTAAHKLGDGVRILGAERILDEALDRRTRTAESLSAAATTRADIVGRANVTFGDIVDEGLSPAFDRLLASFEELSATPQDPIARQDVLASADQFATEVRRYATEIQAIKEDVDSQLTTEVEYVNSMMQEIAEANRLISEEIAPSADLLDRRDRLVVELSEKIDVRVVAREDKTVDVHIAETGFSLVVGRQYSELTVERQASGARLIGHAFGGARHDLTDKVRGGVVGGLLAARDEDLASVEADLDSFVFDVATEINRIHSTGYGTDGVTGRNLFQAPAQREGSALVFQVDPAVANDPAAVAAAQTLALAEGGNGAALALAAFRYDRAINGVEPVEALQGILQSFGDSVYQAEVNAVSRSEAATQLRDLQQSMSGVSLDEEMTNLLRYRQAYSAAVQVMTAADELIQELISIKR